VPYDVCISRQGLAIGEGRRDRTARFDEPHIRDRWQMKIMLVTRTKRRGSKNLTLMRLDDPHIQDRYNGRRDRTARFDEPHIRDRWQIKIMLVTRTKRRGSKNLTLMRLDDPHIQDRYNGRRDRTARFDEPHIRDRWQMKIMLVTRTKRRGSKNLTLMRLDDPHIRDRYNGRRDRTARFDEPHIRDRWQIKIMLVTRTKRRDSKNLIYGIGGK
jgi:non-homologous end joining protein Ku